MQWQVHQGRKEWWVCRSRRRMQMINTNNVKGMLQERFILGTQHSAPQVSALVSEPHRPTISMSVGHGGWLEKERERYRDRQRQGEREIVDQYSAYFYSFTSPPFIFRDPLLIFCKKQYIPSLLTIGRSTVKSYNSFNCQTLLNWPVCRGVSSD